MKYSSPRHQLFYPGVSIDKYQIRTRNILYPGTHGYHPEVRRLVNIEGIGGGISEIDQLPKIINIGIAGIHRYLKYDVPWSLFDLFLK